VSQFKTDWDISNLTASLSKIIEVHFKKILVFFAIVIIAASAIVYKKSIDRANEKKAFNELYKITKNYDKKKADFTAAKEEISKKNDKTKPAPKELETANKENKNLVPATGDMQKDYGTEVKELEDFLASHKAKNASGEAALILSDIYSEYGLAEKGAEVVSQTLSQWNDKNVLYYVMQMRSGDLFASLNQCDKAVNHWRSIAESDSFIAEEAQLKMGVCLQEMGQYSEAKNWFEKIKAKSPNSTEGFNAKRYLRFIEFKSKNMIEEKDSKAQKKETKKDSPS
jgi:lipopolysaccharide biosynthesis regulator YciM